ncbi:Ropporin-1-like protein [Desmophyllum pertusum]|uniref:Ropporin-1-like protein n=1 Tax=Desmophyllum pertusum TaxID=174260 RepID=A0A9W9Z6C7_9CNID|nr:Ropporin-1-like protein [Desmophyllum pertusum]
MPQPEEPIYCSQQINIPPELPDILKQFTKAAIRTQPKDVLQWAYAYFVGPSLRTALDELLNGWEVLLKNSNGVIFWLFACSGILHHGSARNLTLAMKTVCEILSTDLEGGPARIPFSLFKELYTYLAEIDGEIPGNTWILLLNISAMMWKNKMDKFLHATL